MDVIRLVVVTEIAIRDTEDTLQVLDSLAIVGKVPATPARRRAHVEESVEELVRVGVRRVRTLSLDVAGDDAVHRLTLGLVVAVRRCGARLDRGVNLVRVLDDALRVHDSQLLLDAFVNVVQLVAILLLLAESQVFDDFLVRLRRVRRTHGVELDTTLLRAPEDGVVAVADDERGSRVPIGTLLRRALAVHAVGVGVVLSAVEQVERAVETHGVQHGLFDHLFRGFVVRGIGLCERHRRVEVIRKRRRRRRLGSRLGTDGDVGELVRRHARPFVRLRRGRFRPTFVIIGEILGNVVPRRVGLLVLNPRIHLRDDVRDVAAQRERLLILSHGAAHAAVREVGWIVGTDEALDFVIGVIVRLQVAVHVRRALVRAEIRVPDAVRRDGVDERLDLRERSAVVAKVPRASRRQAVDVEEAVKVRGGGGCLSLDVARDDAVHRLTFGDGVQLRRAVRDELLVDLVRIL